MLDNSRVPFSPGKVVCIGRNYSAHIAELENETPSEPVIFLKPSTALSDLREPIVIPESLGACHHEVELAVVIGQQLSRSTEAEVSSAIFGYAVALDLTLRDLQSELKKKGLPWERAKAFDGSCPVSPVISRDQLSEPAHTDLQLTVNGKVRQSGNTDLMIWKIEPLIAHISTFFTLLPGDLILTGTPAGVGPLNSGDQLIVELNSQLQIKTRVS